MNYIQPVCGIAHYPDATLWWLLC